MRAPAVRTLSVKDPFTRGLADCPSISTTGSIRGMRKLYWGDDAKIVKCGSYYYNVSRRPEIYERAH